MTRLLLPVLLALSLPACGTHSVRDDSPSSDLDALVQTVTRQLPNRTLPNGRQYCAELATTEAEQDECLGDLEALNLLRVRDRERALQQLRTGANRIKATRMACSWWQFGCKTERRTLQQGGRPP
jgi:hypothetical protein